MAMTTTSGLTTPLQADFTFVGSLLMQLRSSFLLLTVSLARIWVRVKSPRYLLPASVVEDMP
eukprot:4018688-Amphidinium_carterae.1